MNCFFVIFLFICLCPHGNLAMDTQVDTLRANVKKLQADIARKNMQIKNLEASVSQLPQLLERVKKARQVVDEEETAVAQQHAALSSKLQAKTGECNQAQATLQKLSTQLYYQTITLYCVSAALLVSIVAYIHKAYNSKVSDRQKDQTLDSAQESNQETIKEAQEEKLQEEKA